MWVKAERRQQLKSTYHPRFAAEVVDGEDGVDARDAAEMQADHEVPEVLAGDHAVGVLANQDEVCLEGPAAGRTWKWFRLPICKGLHPQGFSLDVEYLLTILYSTLD